MLDRLLLQRHSLLTNVRIWGGMQLRTHTIIKTQAAELVVGFTKYYEELQMYSFPKSRIVHQSPAKVRNIGESSILLDQKRKAWTFRVLQKAPAMEYSQILFSPSDIRINSRNAVRFFLQSASEIKDPKIQQLRPAWLIIDCMKGTLKRYRPPDKEKEKLSATTKGHDANSSENILFLQ